MKYPYLCLTFLLTILSPPLVAQDVAASFNGFDDDIVFPSDAGVINLTQPPYSVRGDGTTDNTAAIQRALDENPSGNKVFYLPEGVYLVSNTIQWKGTDGAEEKRNILQGQNTRNTILKLVDNATGYQDPASNKPVINTGFKPAQRFRNAIRNLTVSTGSGNPGAVGVQFIANNQGGMYSVIIRSEDGAGVIGLDMQYTDEVGPLLIKELLVEGFDVGIKTEFQTASQTFEDVYLKNQNVYGWHNTGTQTVFARKLVSENAVPAILNNREGRFLLVDATLENTASSGGDAIINQKSFYARNVATPGYEIAITNNLLNFRGNSRIAGEYIEEYWANGAYSNRYGGPFELFPSPDQMLNLPVEETPKEAWETDLSQWVSPLEFGGRPDDGIDDTEAIQQAIDAGKTTVYLPNDRWQIDGEVVLRGNVRRLIGTEARLLGPGSISVEDGTAPTVTIERVEVQNSLRLVHNTARPLVLSAVLGTSLNYESTEQAGDLFLEDVAIEAFTIQPQQRLWARQLNIETNTEESATAKFTNDGGTAWILGYKTEMGGTTIKTLNGGITELLGALHVSNTGDAPRFVTEEASFSAATVHTAPAGTEFPIMAVEQRDEETRTTPDLNLSNSYTAFAASAIADSIVYVDNNDPQATASGEWLSSDGSPGGYLESDFQYADPDDDRSFSFVSPLPAPGRYEVFLRWVNDRSGQSHSGHATNAPVAVQHQDGETSLSINQKVNGGQWNSLGTYSFDEQGTVTLTTQGANGKVIADGVRLVRLDANLTQESTTVVTIRAAGRTNTENMSLRIDGQEVASWTNIGGDAAQREFIGYTYESKQEIEASQIRVAFTNDDEQDRDLRVDKIEVDGAAYQSEAATTYSTGTWTASNGCAGGFKRSEWLHCNGYFAYDQSNARTANTKTLAKEPDASEVQLFPNPAQDVVRVRLPSREGKAVIIVSDMLGQEILRRQTSTNNIDLPVHQLTPGLYQVRVQQNNQEITRKLLIAS